MRQKILWALLMVVFTIGIAGCSSHSTNPHPNALVKLGFELESNDLATLVNYVTLSVVLESTTIQEDTLELVDGTVTDSVTLVPDQTITIILRAFSASNVLLYIGDTTFVVPAEETFPVNILLSPPDDLLMLRAGPLFQTASPDGDTVEVFVDVHNVSSLFGAAFRLTYDPEALNFVDAREGSFVSGNGAVQTLAGIIDQTTTGILPYFVTRVRNNDGSTPAGASGSGRLVTFRFTPILEGPTDFSIGAETVKMTQPNGANVPLFNNLVLESATVDVQ